MPEYSILLIEDNASARDALSALLEEQGYRVHAVEHGLQGLEQLDLAAPDIVITDLAMPVLSGFDFLRELRARPQHADVPVIIVSAHHEVADRVRGLDLGADDFLSKPLCFDELLARIRRQLSRSDRQREAVRQSVVDSLTGVLNRRGIANYFAREAERVRKEGSVMSLVAVDIDDFKPVNDTWGHAAGDTALCVVARALQDALRANDRVARIGGDEFVVLLSAAGPEHVRVLRDRLRSLLPLVIDLSEGAQIRVELSLGLATAEPDESFESLLARADADMYEDKRQRKGAARRS